MQADTSALALGLYEALFDGGGLLPALRGLARHVGASSHAVHMIRYRDGRPVGSVSTGEGGVAGAPLEDYARYWVRHDPWAVAGAMLPPGVHDIAHTVLPETLRRSRIWNEWGRPNDAAFHALGVSLLQREDRMGGAFFHRRACEAPFGAAETAVLNAIFPHLRRVFEADAALAGTAPNAGADALRGGLDALPEGVALIGAERRLVFANAALLAMVAQRDGLVLGHEGLDVPVDTPDGARRALGRAVTAALAAADGKVALLPFAGSLVLPRPSGRAPWTVRALPMLPSAAGLPLSGFRGAMLLVSDPERRARPAAALLGRLFGLTAAEASLAASLAAGRSLDEHAKRRGVSRETARTQLAAIRRKTGCRRQADLAALFARLPG